MINIASDPIILVHSRKANDANTQLFLFYFLYMFNVSNMLYVILCLKS